MKMQTQQETLNKNIVILDEIILEHTHARLRSDGIVLITYPDNFSFTLKESIESVNAIGQLTKSIPHPILKTSKLDEECFL